MFDFTYILLTGHAGFVGDRLYTFLCFLHNVFVLQTFNIRFLALHIRVKQRASLKELEVSTYFCAVASLKTITPSQVLEL